MDIIFSDIRDLRNSNNNLMGLVRTYEERTMDTTLHPRTREAYNEAVLRLTDAADALFDAVLDLDPQMSMPIFGEEPQRVSGGIAR